MRVLPPEPKTRAQPTAPFSVDPRNLLALYAIGVRQPRVGLGEVRLREPARDLNIVDPARKRVIANLAEYPLRRITAESASRRRAQRRLRWAACFFLVLGLMGVGTWGWFYAEATVFQAYQSWRLDQLVKHRPAELRALVEKYLAEIGIEGTKASPPLVAVPVPTKSPSPGPLPHPPAQGSLIGLMEIPRLALSTVVLEGDSSGILRTAAGHIPGTALPGAVGNVAIAAHRDTFFRALRIVHKDDVIALETPSGTYHYRVDSTHIVAPDDVQVIKPSDQPSLTLVTCYPFFYVGSAPKRYIVHARQIAPSSVASLSVTTPGTQLAPLPEVQSRAREKSPWQPSSAQQAKLDHQVTRRHPTPRHVHRSAEQSGGRQASTLSVNDEDVADAASADPPTHGRKRGGLRRRALSLRKRFASWFGSRPKRTSDGD